MFNLVVMTPEEFNSIGNKRIFISNDEVCLSYVKGRPCNGAFASDLGDNACQISFNIVDYDDISSDEELKNIVINIPKGSYPNLKELIKLQKSGTNIRFTGDCLLNIDELNLGMVSKDVLSSSLGCSFKIKPSPIFTDMLEIVNFSDIGEISDFSPSNVSIKGVKFGGDKGKKSGNSSPTRKKRMIFDLSKEVDF